MDGTDVGADAASGVLSHYGVKGMKWGVTRTASQLARAAQQRRSDSVAAKKAAAEPSEDFKRTLPSRSKPVSALSNQEIQDLVTRLNLEQNYARLTAESNVKTASAVTRGRKYATKLIVDVGQEQVKRVARAAATQKVDKVMSTKGLDVPKQLKTLKGK